MSLQQLLLLSTLASLWSEERERLCNCIYKSWVRMSQVRGNKRRGRPTFRGNLNYRELSLELVFPVSRIFSSFLPGYNPAISSLEAKWGWREGWEFHNEASLLLITIPWCLPIQSKSDSICLGQTSSVTCLCSMRRDSMSILIRIGFDNNTEISVT